MHFRVWTSPISLSWLTHKGRSFGNRLIRLWKCDYTRTADLWICPSVIIRLIWEGNAAALSVCACAIGCPREPSAALLQSLHKKRSVWKGFPRNYFVQLGERARDTVGLNRSARGWKIFFFLVFSKSTLLSDRRARPMGSPSASASRSLPPARVRRASERGRGRLPERGVCVGGEWMTSGGWRQHVWDWRVRSTQLGRDRTHSWLRAAFLHKTGL